MIIHLKGMQIKGLGQRNCSFRRIREKLLGEYNAGSGPCWLGRDNALSKAQAMQMSGGSSQPQKGRAGRQAPMEGQGKKTCRQSL